MVKEITFVDIGINKRALLNFITKSYYMKIRTGLILRRIRTRGGLLSVR
jgi:hypothetical protein